jgi:hypothetical protein
MAIDPRHDKSLTIIGGFVADVDPADLPEGGSPICCDMDFTVGSVFSRDGIQNVYTYQGADQEVAADSGVDIPVTGAVAWTDPDNIAENTVGTYASVELNTPASTFGVINSTSTITITPVSSVTFSVGFDTVLDRWMFMVIRITFPDSVTGIVDAAGNTWSKVTNAEMPSTIVPPGKDFEIWKMQVTAPSGPTSHITVNFSGSTIYSIGWFDTVGLIAPNGTPVSTVGTTSGASFNTGPFTTTQPTVLFFLGEADNGTGIPSGAWNEVGVGGMLYMLDVPAGANTVTCPLNTPEAAQAFAGMLFAFTESGGTPGPGFSDILRATTFGATVPLTSSVIGLEVFVNGKQSSPTTQLTVTPIGGGTPFTFMLPSSDGTVSVGGPGNFLGFAVPPTALQVNNPGFGFNITAQDTTGTDSVVDISGVEIKVWFTPPGVSNFNFVDTFDMENGGLFTLAIDNTGVLWQEDVLNLPDVLVPIFTALEPNSYAQAINYDNREWIALSDRNQATDMPRQYNGQWTDRVSQVAPGAPCACSATSNAYDIVNITQPPPVDSTASFTTPGVHAILLSTGPGNNSTAGSVITVYYGMPGATAPLTPPDPNIVVGQSIYLHNFGTHDGIDPDGTYVVTSVQTTKGHPDGGGNGFYNTFCVISPSVGLFDVFPPPNGSFYQVPLATVTTTTAIPNVQVGSQISIAGNSVPAWDATWTVLNTPNAAQLIITATSLTGNVATYDFTLQTGTLPTSGEQITVIGTNNGNGIFNVVNATISAAGPSSLSISLNSPDITSAAEDGNAVINGTEFQFDPGLSLVGTITSPIFGTGTGGTIVQPGNLGAGTRQAVVFFFTRNNAITGCSNPVTFTLTEGADSLVCTQVPLGPPNTVKRGVAFTGAGGAFFYYIPQPVQVVSNGQKLTYTSTVINDNTSTSATFTFTDGVLLQSTEIDIEENNLFEQIELGSCLGFIAYSSRIFAIGEQNKIQNLINLSFDGGFLPNPASAILPLGWTNDVVFGGNNNLTVSTLFGNAYEISNSTGSDFVGQAGMIWQNAFQDFNQAPIVNINTQYGVRVTASSVGTSQAGNLVVDFFSPSFAKIYGSFTIPLASMTTIPAIFTGDLLTTEFFSSVPSDLQYRIYTTNLGAGASVVTDRTEPFDLSLPVLSTQLRASYENNFEAFDDVTGNLGLGVQNQQACRSAFTLFDNLYIVKTGSMYSTADNGTTEPDEWRVKEVSPKVGTPSVKGVDSGETWAVIAGRAGIYVFDGGQPVKFSPEIDPLWDTVEWDFGYTLWVRNDTNARRISIGIPIPTPNQWMPKFPKNENPTQPNVVLTCQYKELMSSGALAGEGPVRQGYQGTLKSFQLGRKWSAWSIQAADADFITREDGSAPLFYCGDANTAKIYQQVAGTHLDDFAGIFDQYYTYPFLKSDDAQALQAGLHELQSEMVTALVSGGGFLNVTVIPNTLDSPFGERLDPPFELFDSPSFGDTEMPTNNSGNRFFIAFETDRPGDWFKLSRVVLNVYESPWAPVRGSNES